ncbi:hypothetical protein ACUY4Q_003709 [Phytobacter sp. AG2a]
MRKVYRALAILFGVEKEAMIEAAIILEAKRQQRIAAMERKMLNEIQSIGR